MSIDSKRFKYIAFLLVDVFFAAMFFSERAALLLSFFIAPLVFILFLAFFQNPSSFIKQWNSWPAGIIKFSFLLVGFYIFLKVGKFPALNDFLVKGQTASHLINSLEGLLFVFLATVGEMGFIIGIIFNFLALILPKKFGENAVPYELSFFKALIPTFLFTLLFIVGLVFLGSLVK